MDTVLHWNRFEPADDDFPNHLGEELLVHSIGTQWGELCGQGSSHLWRWAGWELELVEECIKTLLI